MGAGVRNVAHRGERVEIEDADVASGSRSRNVEIAAVGVRCDVIESACAAGELDLLDVVWAAGLGLREAGERGGGDKNG
jgi:hypothetical protein